jgi:hypothetical protein
MTAYMPRNISQVKPLHLRCDTCKAPPGDPCETPYGRVLRYPHHARRQEAVDLSRLLRELWAARRFA